MTKRPDTVPAVFFMPVGRLPARLLKEDMRITLSGHRIRPPGAGYQTPFLWTHSLPTSVIHHYGKTGFREMEAWENYDRSLGVQALFGVKIVLDLSQGRFCQKIFIFWRIALDNPALTPYNNVCVPKTAGGFYL